MLPVEQNELVTRVGRGAPMGETLRRYWMPFSLSRELAADGAPMRVRLLGEDLVAFRDTSGRVGLMDDRCPHRAVSLWLGRNEEDGLRCAYHGWKFDVEGNCVDQMNEPDSFASKIHATAYPAIEAGEIVWAYMGPKELQPPPPNFEWVQAAPSQRHVSRVIQDCNWVQALEGGIDTSHAPIMHRSVGNNGAGISPDSAFARGRAPRIELDQTDYGYRYFGVRELDEDKYYVRGYHYVMPFHQLRPQQQVNRSRDDSTVQAMVAGHMWVPVDDDTTMTWNWMLSLDQPLTDEHRLERGNGNGPDHVDPNNGWRSYDGRWNDWGIDRQRQKAVNFSGVDGVNKQDRAVQESMGNIVDRSIEHLGPADRAIITMRQMLLEAVRTVREGGDPPGTGDSYYHVRAWEKVMPRVENWRDDLLPLMYPAGPGRELVGAR
jgi:phthalate 4,5-dioxygenase oxygenase subunit